MTSGTSPKLGKTKPGELSDDDQFLWQQVKRTVEPLGGRKEEFAALLKESERKTTDVGKALNAPSRKQSAALSIRPPRSYPAAPYSPPVPNVGPGVRPNAGIDDKTARKLLKGRISIDDRIDLHGMTQDQAHRLLAGFLARSHAANMRMVLVITGKGRLSDGILRQAVPQWLREPQLSIHVSAFRQAHVTHGGEGALYVRLRRADRLPARKGVSR